MLFMVECIVNILQDKFNIEVDEALIFYFDLCNRRKLEHLISHIEKFKNFEEMKLFYLGGE